MITTSTAEDVMNDFESAPEKEQRRRRNFVVAI